MKRVDGGLPGRTELGDVAKGLVRRLLAAAERAALGIEVYRTTGDAMPLACAMDRLEREVARISATAAGLADPTVPVHAVRGANDETGIGELDEAAGHVVQTLTLAGLGEAERMLVMIDRLRGAALGVRNEAEILEARSRLTEC